MAAALEPYKAKFEKALYEKNAFTDMLAQLEGKTGVKRTYFVAGFVAVLALWLIFGYAAAFLSTFLGFVYPAYQSVKAIESVRKDDDTQWLTYWVVFGTFSLGEFFTDLFLSWFPFYYLVKMIFLGWCMAPIESNGSNILYHRFIKPFVLKHEKEIDDSLGKVTDLASDTLKEGEEEVEVEENLPSSERHESGDEYNSDSSSDYSVGLTDPQISSHDGKLSDSEDCDRSDQVIIGASEEVNEGDAVSELQSCSLKEEPPPSPNLINSPGGVDVSSSERVENRNNSHEFETTVGGGKVYNSLEVSRGALNEVNNERVDDKSPYVVSGNEVFPSNEMESNLGNVDLTNVASSKVLHAPLRGSGDVSKGNVEALHGDPCLQSHARDGDDQELPSDCKGDHAEDVAGVIRDPFDCDENVGNLMARKDGDGGVDDGYTSSEEGEQGTPDGSISESNLVSDGVVPSYVTGDASVALEGSGASNTGVELVKGGTEISDMKGEISEGKEGGTVETRTTVTVDLSLLEERQPISDEIGQGEPEKSVDSVTRLDKDVSDDASEGASQEGVNGQSNDTDVDREENVNMSNKMLEVEASDDAGLRNADMSHQEESGQCQDSNVNRKGRTANTLDNVTTWQEEANDASSGNVVEVVTGKADLEEDGVERNGSEEICQRIVQSDIEEKDEEVDESCGTTREVSEHQTVCGESRSVQDEEKKCEVPGERDEDEEETDAGDREVGLKLKGKSACVDGEEGFSQDLCFMDSSSGRDQNAEADKRLSEEDCSVEMSKNVDTDDEPLGGETEEQLQMGDLSSLEEGEDPGSEGSRDKLNDFCHLENVDSSKAEAAPCREDCVEKINAGAISTKEMEAEVDAIVLCQDIKPGQGAEIICEGNKNNSSENMFGVPEDHRDDNDLLEDSKEMRDEKANVAEDEDGLTKFIKDARSCCQDIGEDGTKDGELLEERKDSKGAEEEEVLTKSLEQHSNYVCQEVGGDEDGGQETVKFEGKTNNYEDIEDVRGDRSETELSEDQGQESVMEDGESADKGTDSEVDQESRCKEDEDAPSNKTDESERDEIAVDDTVQKKPNISSDAEQSAIIKGLQPLGQEYTAEGEGEGNKKNGDAGNGITDQSLLQSEVVGGDVGEGIVAGDLSDEPEAKILVDNRLLVQEEANSIEDKLLDETRGDASRDEILIEKQVAAPTRHLSDSFTSNDERQFEDEPDNPIAGVVELDMECSEGARADKDGAKCTRAEQEFREVEILPESLEDVDHSSLSGDVVLMDTIEVSDKRQQVQQTAMERTQDTDHHLEDAVDRNDTDLTHAERHVKDFEYQEDETIEVSPGSLQMTNLDEVRDLESIEGNELSGVIVQVGDPGMSDNRQVEPDLNAGKEEDNVGAASLYSDHGVSSSHRETTVTSTVISIKSKTVLEGNSLKSFHVIETNVTIETRSEAIDN